MLTADTLKILDAAKKKPGKKAAGGLVYDQHRPEAEHYLRLLRLQDELEREMSLVRDSLVRAIVPWHQEQCAKRKDYETTVHIPTEDGTLTITFKNQWGKIHATRQAELEAALGQRFAAAFKNVVALKVSKDLDEAKLEQLVLDLAEALGVDRFAASFEAERTLVPTEQFTKAIAITMDADTRQQLGLKQVVAVGQKAA
jgi:hypothetical protein